jgi:hypothetical protein
MGTSMKFLAMVFIIVGLQTKVHAATILTFDTCTDLVGEFAIDDFSFDSDGNNALYTSYKLNNVAGVDFINNTRKNLVKTLQHLCNSKNGKVTIEELKELHHDACSDECIKQSSSFKPSFAGSYKMKENANMACLTVCNRTQRKINMFIKGINVGKINNSKNTSDCGAGVTSTGRNIIKSTNIDAVEKTINSTSK